jgi:Protein of unknown function (DUF3099)
MKEKPISISSAKYGHSDEIPGRMKKYLISMIIRTACFIGAIFTEGVLRWVLIAGSLILPYIAVVVANAGQEQSFEPSETIENQKQIEF